MATLVSSTVRHLSVLKTDLLRLIDLSFYKMVFIINIQQDLKVAIESKATRQVMLVKIAFGDHGHDL